jgi:hypothetical protein
MGGNKKILAETGKAADRPPFELSVVSPEPEEVGNING